MYNVYRVRKASRRIRALGSLENYSARILASGNDRPFQRRADSSPAAVLQRGNRACPGIYVYIYIYQIDLVRTKWFFRPRVAPYAGYGHS